MAIGISGMAETPGNESKQCSFSVTASFNVGSTIEITDSKGKVLLSHKAETSGTSIVFSDPSLKIGETYTLKVDGNTQTVTQSELVAKSSAGAESFGGFQKPNRGQGFERPSGDSPFEGFGQKMQQKK